MKHWSVSVCRDGESIVTIESNCLSGRDISDEDAETIRICARHLLGFVGEGEDEPGCTCSPPSFPHQEHDANCPKAVR